MRVFEFLLLLLAAAVMLAPLARRIGAPYPALRWGRGRRPRGYPSDPEPSRLLDRRRARLLELRRTGVIGDDVFHRLEEELDLADLDPSG